MTGKDRTSDSKSAFPDSKDSKPVQNHSQNQADGTAADRPRGDTQAQDAELNKGLADDSGMGEKKSKTPEHQAAGKIDPSSPTKSTEGGTTSMPRNPTMDSAGEIGEPSGKGTIKLKENTMNKEQGNSNQGNKDQGNKDNKDANQGQQSKQGAQQNLQADQKSQGQNPGNQQNMSGRSDRQESGSSQSGNQSGSQSDQGRDQQKASQSSQDKKDSGKSSEHMDEDNNQGDRKTA